MTTLEELLQVHHRLTIVHVERWVARGLLRPSADGENWVFEPVDVARAHLLADLTDQLGFDDEAVETVVDLLDQVHTLRRQLHQLGVAIGQQPTTTRESIAVALKDLRER
ncbi:chaperone modulatory protein CbpM [Rhodospirillales bacterium URHD0017]|nr:chaperone modulatory protein CbpM [Rhodospirillales bacterium URHD0017]